LVYTMRVETPVRPEALCAAHEGKGLVKLVGPEFNVAPIAFCFQLESPLRRKVNLRSQPQLLTLRENGTYQQIYDKWFGSL
jgi:polar amino acid transport system substrate-binding protein